MASPDPPLGFRFPSAREGTLRHHTEALETGPVTLLLTYLLILEMLSGSHGIFGTERINHYCSLGNSVLSTVVHKYNKKQFLPSGGLQPR